MAKANCSGENFDKCGPRHLKEVNWNEQEHRMIIMASLNKGVTVAEKDRQKRRIGNKSMAPKWWEFFHFKLINANILVDEADFSAIGAIFEYEPPKNLTKCYNISPQNTPPKYVVSFRGTLLKPRTLFQDIYNDLAILFDGLSKTSRFQFSLNAVKKLIAKVGPKHVWLTGHSLGAATALQIGKTMAREGCRLETYLFNPPYCSLPIQKLPNRHLKFGVQVCNTFAHAGLHYLMTNSENRQIHNESFRALSRWTPYVFVNRNDPISCEYIGYFEFPDKMKELGLGCIAKIGAQRSIKSSILGTFGGQSEAPHLMPSAVLVKKKYVEDEKFTESHGLHQWWAPRIQLKTKLFCLAYGGC